MSIVLHPFQQEFKARILQAWRDGAKNVLGVLPTGAGKTVVFSNVLSEFQGYRVAIAHRQELVGQISLALARNGTRHRIIAPAVVARECAREHVSETGGNYVDQRATCVVASVDTLLRRNESWYSRVGLWVCDEGHHNLRDNKWGRANALFPNAIGLGVTATPMRADGKGLGRHADGVFDEMIIGPGQRDLIEAQWLSDYRILAPLNTLDLTQVSITGSGDYSLAPLHTAVSKSTVTGDAVAHYKRHADGQLGITFCCDVELALQQAEAYQKAGVPAAVITAKTPDGNRRALIKRFKNRDILQLVNVDLFGEGFDLPALEVVSFCRPTESYALYAQQFGRVLRTMQGKTHGLVIDHVGNVRRHGLPDKPRIWSLDRRESRSRGKTTVEPVRVCQNCTGAYERERVVCPYCGHRWVPAERSGPEYVDGDLHELSPDVLAQMRAQIDKPLVLPWGATPAVQGAVTKRYREKQEAQTALREAIALWAGRQSQETDLETVRRLQRRFYLEYGIDVLSAQMLNAREAGELMERIKG